jgi:hypothetical protein
VALGAGVPSGICWQDESVSLHGLTICCGIRTSIGLILCKTRNRVVTEYAWRDFSKPIGISEYKLAAALPDKRHAADN